MAARDVDAVVIGSGPNGLVAANHLADAGWSVLVCEEQPEPGGAVRSAEVTAPGFVSDLYSAFYPLGLASPVLRRMGLEHHGLRWLHAPAVLAHPRPDGRAAVLHRDLDRTAAGLDAEAVGDGDAWRRIVERFRRLRAPLLDSLFTPFPPVRAGLRLATRLGPSGAADFARFAILPVRSLAAQEFSGEGPGLLLAGNALHTDLTPESAGSAVYGWLLAMLGQTYGFPVPEGGAGRLSGAMVRRLEASHGEVVCSRRVDRVLVRQGRAVGVRLADGTEVGARRAVLADVPAPSLYGDLLTPGDLPWPVVEALRRFSWDDAVVKVDWALSSPVPWTAPGAVGAGTVHLGDGMDELTRYSAQLATGVVPDRPFVLVGQMTTSDPSRSPQGTESAWAYAHIPRRVHGDAGGEGLDGTWDERQVDLLAGRLEAQVERHAPGFRERVLARHVELVGVPGRRSGIGPSSVNNGTAALHQQLVFRPLPGLARPETPVPGLFLASASAHPGGGVHGAAGANAAAAALKTSRLTGRAVARALAGAEGYLNRPGHGPLR